jgi:hypothetical protein
MNIDLARYVIRSAFRASHELSDLLPFLKSQLPAEEYKSYAKAISSAIAAIQLDILNKVTADHPGLESEIESSMAAYDRYL